MKKIVIFIFLFIFFACILNKNSEIIIPNNSIRIRIIANSNDLHDQQIKYAIKDEISKEIYPKLQNISDYNDARKEINNSMDVINNIVKKYTSDFSIYFGNNYFPRKKYKGVTYKEGNYESLVIKLGDAKGKNFWCVLFPPLCMIDESRLNDVSYSFLVSELLNKIQ